jgi:hypothetical protein
MCFRRFPYKGFYHLALMASEDGYTKPDEIVYNYLFRVQDPSKVIESFPIIMNPILWKDCCLIAPKNYGLHSYDVHFSIIVPSTGQVRIMNGECEVQRLEAREIENSWVGLVAVSFEHDKYIYVEAEFDGKFKRLLRFRDGSGHSSAAIKKFSVN